MSFGDKCKYCGCTEEKACEEKDGKTCSWIMKNICSSCYSKCTYQEKLDFLSIWDYGTYFSMISDKKKKEIEEKVKNGS